MVSGVTTEEARSNLQKRKENLQETKEDISKAKKFVSRITKKPTRKESFGVASRRRRIIQRREQAAEPTRQSIRESERSVEEEEENIEKRAQEIERVEKENQRIKAQNAARAKEIQEYKKARQLILKGKTFAAQGDTGTQSKIKELRNKGLVSVKEQEFRAETLKLIKPSLFEGKPEKIVTKELKPVTVDSKSKASLQELETKAVDKVLQTNSTINELKTKAKDKITFVEDKTPKTRSDYLRNDKFTSPKTSKAQEENREQYLRDKSLKEITKEQGLFSPITVQKSARVFGTGVTAIAAIPTAKLFGKDLNSQSSIKATKSVGRFVGDAALFSAFSQSFVTRGQYLRQLSLPTDIKPISVSSKTKGGKTQTDVVFEASKRGVKRTGFLKIDSKSVPITKEGGVTLSKTASTGQGAIGQRSLTPSGKVNIIKAKTLKVFSGGKVLSSKKVAIQTAKGGVKVGEQAVKGTKSAGFKIGNKLSIQGGRSVSPVGQSQSFGTNVQVKSLYKSVVIPTGKKASGLLINAPSKVQTVIKPTTNLNLEIVKTQLGSTLELPTFATSTFGTVAGLTSQGKNLVEPSSSSRELLPTYRQIPTPTQIPTPSQPTIPKPDVSLSGRSISRTRSRTQQRTEQTIIQETTPREIQITRQTIDQSQRGRGRGRNIQRSRGGTTPPNIIVPNAPTPLPPKIPFPIFKLSSGTFIKKKKKKKKDKGLTYVPGFTALSLGLTQKTTKSKLKQQAKSPNVLGIRRIPILK